MKASPTFSIIVPTHDHSVLLPLALESIAAQTLTKFEVFIIGDGATQQVAIAAKKFCQQDSRFHWLPKPKSGRRGEVYRDDVIRNQAQAPYIAYVSDDDLWHPHHLTLLQASLQKNDFVAAKAVRIEVSGEVNFYPGLIENAVDRHLMRQGVNFIPLSCGAHRRDAYLKLPIGWRETPPGQPTDLYMWKQWLEKEVFRVSDLTDFTVLNFPSPPREGWTSARRKQEMMTYQRILSDKKAWQSFKQSFALAMFRQLSAVNRLAHQEQQARIAAEVWFPRFRLPRFSQD